MLRLPRALRARTHTKVPALAIFMLTPRSIEQGASRSTQKVQVGRPGRPCYKDKAENDAPCWQAFCNRSGRHRGVMVRQMLVALAIVGAAVAQKTARVTVDGGGVLDEHVGDVAAHEGRFARDEHCAGLTAAVVVTVVVVVRDVNCRPTGRR